jgi:hypothetical protein
MTEGAETLKKHIVAVLLLLFFFWPNRSNHDVPNFVTINV